MSAQVVRRASYVLERRFAGEVLLATQGRREVDRLEGTSAAVWELLDEPRPLGELVEALVDTYGAQEREVETDVRRLLWQLQERGHVEVGA